MRERLTQFAAALSVVAAVFACSKDGPSPPNDGTPDDEVDGSVRPGPDDGGVAVDASKPPERFVDVTTETMSFGGQTRSYILGKPKTYDASRSYPLVLSFHGNPSSASIQAAILPFDIVSQNAAIIVYPQANTDAWDLYTPTDTNADMDWIHALPAEIATKVNIDTSKIYGFGYSGGGFFLSQFACRFGADLFKAVSINAGGAPYEAEMGYATLGNGCYDCPGGPVATLITHGASDGEVEPGSGEFAKTCFATYNGCGDTLSESTPAPCQTADGCPAETPVKYCMIPGQSHAPWDKAMAESWSFFNAVP